METFITTLTEICLLDPWQTEALEERINYALFAYDGWVEQLVQRMIRLFPQCPSNAELYHFLEQDGLLAWARRQYRLQIHVYPLQPRAPQPLAAELPQIYSPGELVQWLGISVNDLEWFADRAGLANASSIGKFHHYHIKTIAKRRGGQRLLEIPKPTLKHIQRRIHDSLLIQLPRHPSACGFIKTHNALDHARRHTGQAVVLSFDLQDCFLHVHGGQVFQAFRSLGYSDQLSRYWMALCTHRLTKAQLKQQPLSSGQRQLAGQNHLPQGSPSSPLLSHFALTMVDRRLSALAGKFGANYSRYADDLVLSGGPQLQQHFRQLEQIIGSIVREQGFRLNFRKSRCLGQSSQQRITGITVNQHSNMPRREFDRLKAELHNCVHLGWRSQKPADCQDYRAHLRGRINWCRQLNPRRAEKLEKLFAAIVW